MRITLPSGTAAEIAHPVGNPSMGLVIAPDIFGLRPLYDDLVARLADEWNMVVVAVEPFPSHELGPEVEPRFAAVPSLDDELHLRDLLEAADATKELTIGLLGFCMGGMYAFKAARSDRFDRIASFYGMIRIPEAWAGPGQREPLDHLAAGQPDRVLAIIGGRDHYTPADDVDALEALGATVVRYPDGEHGFAHDPSRATHRADDADDAFERTREWFLGW